MKKGLFIVIEGIDGSGKGTQSKRLKSWLTDKNKHATTHSVFHTMEPTGGKIGVLLRNALKDGTIAPKILALLFAADRIEHCKEIEQHLEEGKIVISDRYLYSSIAYQGSQGVDKEWIMEINKFSLIPDIVFYLDITPESGLKRIFSRAKSYEHLKNEQKERDYLEKIDSLEKVRKNYLKLADENPFFVTINAEKTRKEVQGSIRKVMGRLLKAGKTSNDKDLRYFL